MNDSKAFSDACLGKSIAWMKVQPTATAALCHRQGILVGRFKSRGDFEGLMAQEIRALKQVQELAVLQDGGLG